MQKPISLNTLRFTDKKGIFVIEIQIGIVYGDYAKMEIEIAFIKKHYESLYNMELLIEANRNETLTRSDIHAVFMFTAPYLQVPQVDILRKIRKRHIVEARRFAVAICLERGLKPAAIENVIKFDHATIIHHHNIFKDLCKVESGYEDRFIELQEYVLTKLNGRFKEDGSGEKLKKDVK